MKHYFISFIIALLGLGLISCQREQDPQFSPELSVSQQETLTLPASEISHRISVLTNLAPGQWSVLSQSSWLKVNIENNGILLSAAANEAPQRRHTTVQVIGGGLKHTFEVVQSAASTTLEVGFAPEAIDQWGGELRVDVNSNVDSWIARSDADWIELTPNYRDGVVSIKVSEHTERTDRIATVEVIDQATSIIKTFEVVQKGIIYYMLPCSDPELSDDELVAYELGRRSKLKKSPSYFDQTYKFTTVSPAFSEIHYTIDYLGDKSILKSQMILSSPSILDEKGKTEFFTFLKEQGFEELHTGIFFSEKHSIEVELKLDESQPYVLCTHYLTEDSPQPSVSQLPLEVSVFGKTTPAEVDEWNKANSGKIDTHLSIGNSRRAYRVIEGDENRMNVITRIYNFRYGLLESTIHTDQNIIRYLYYVIVKSGTKFFLTKEFRKVIYREGFKLHTANQSTNSYVFRNPETKIEMAVRAGADAYPISQEKKRSVVELKFKLYN